MMKRRSSATCMDDRCNSTLIKRTKVQAQRKFAQGSNSYAGSSGKIITKASESCTMPAFSPTQQSTSTENDECELNSFTNLPTIDDFLTFLCYRETDVLPERLNYLNTPQFDATPSKEKTSAKSSTVPSSFSSTSTKSPDQNKASDTFNSTSKSKKKVPDYKLRSKDAQRKIINKPRNSLALKHNQRLRKVVQAKITENKLQNLKNKNNVINNIFNSLPKNAAKPEHKNAKNRPLTRALNSKQEEFQKSPVENKTNHGRVTRRNSSLEKHYDVHFTKPSPKKTFRAKSVPPNVTKQEAAEVAKTRASPKKVPAKTLCVSIPKYKPPTSTANTNVTGAMKKSPVKPVTRSTRSGSALHETIPKTSTSTRPSRRTKEAATLFMEMLGRDLLCPDESGDDDDMSVESFPELPNTEQHMRREKEIKEMLQKAKGQEKSTSSPTPTTKSKLVTKSHIDSDKHFHHDTPKTGSAKFPQPGSSKAKSKLPSESSLCGNSTEDKGKSQNAVKPKTSIKLMSATSAGKSWKDEKLTDTRSHGKASDNDDEAKPKSKPILEPQPVPAEGSHVNSSCVELKKKPLSKDGHVERKNSCAEETIRLQNKIVATDEKTKAPTKPSNIVVEKSKPQSRLSHDGDTSKQTDRKLGVNSVKSKLASKQHAENSERKSSQSGISNGENEQKNKPQEVVKVKVLESRKTSKETDEKINAKTKCPIEIPLECIVKKDMVKVISKKDLDEECKLITSGKSHEAVKPIASITKTKPMFHNAKILGNPKLKAQICDKPETKPVTITQKMKPIAPKAQLEASNRVMKCETITNNKHKYSSVQIIEEKLVTNATNKIKSSSTKTQVEICKTEGSVRPNTTANKMKQTMTKSQVQIVFQKPDSSKTDVLAKSKVKCDEIAVDLTNEEDSEDEFLDVKLAKRAKLENATRVATTADTSIVSKQEAKHGAGVKEVVVQTGGKSTSTITNARPLEILQKKPTGAEPTKVNPPRTVARNTFYSVDISDDDDDTTDDDDDDDTTDDDDDDEIIPDSNSSKLEVFAKEMTKPSTRLCTRSRQYVGRKSISPRKKSVKIIRTRNKSLEKHHVDEKIWDESANSLSSVKQISSSSDCGCTKTIVQEQRSQKLVFNTDTSSLEAENMKKPIIQAVVSSNLFCLDTKKVIFKKSKSSGTCSSEEMSPRKTEAFSADNENSVYAFEPDLPTTSPPFRRLKPTTPQKIMSTSNSIAVQVNIESDGKIECTGTAETQVSSTTDCGDQVFYIPIQTSDTNSTLGVAVKLDTDGQNQKIIMSATLVTKSPSFSTPTATTVASQSSLVATSCVQTETIKPVKLAHVEPVPKDTSLVKEMPDKVVATADSQTSVQTPSNSPSSTVTSPKCNKKVTSTTKISQSVKIVKINKQNKTKPSKLKARPMKNKCTKKLVDEPPAKVPKLPPPTGEILEAPTFYPTEEEFTDPLEYIDTIRSVAGKYGLCRIVPPSTFRPECKVADDMRFTAYNNYVHKMLNRWGPNVKELMAIRKFLATQNTPFEHPSIGSMEVDLPRLYQVVQQCGGLKAVMEKERWHQVADIMKIPKLAQDRITKLDDIYCKYLLSYDILSHNEREKLFDDVEKEWKTHLEDPNNEENQIFEDIDECIVEGKRMSLSCFYRIARNTMMMCYGNPDGKDIPSTEAIENEFWSHVSNRKSHICVYSGSIDSGEMGYGFSMAKNSTFRKHPWNLKVLTNNSASILRCLGPVTGVTVPTLHVGMLYSVCCWYREPLGLPWVEYLHTGADKIWYGIPDEYSDQFKTAMISIAPQYCRDKQLWLPSDTVMIPPTLLTSKNISLSKVVQQPGQFVVVFPKSFTSSISTGYIVSESVYFAHASWLNSAKQIFKDMQESGESSTFSLEQLVITVANDLRASLLILNEVKPLLIEIKEMEVTLRSELRKLGLNTGERIKFDKKRKSKNAFTDEEKNECEVCRVNLFVSMVVNSKDEVYYCLKHAINLFQKKPEEIKKYTLMYTYTEEELEEILNKLDQKIEAKRNKKSHSK